MAGASCIFGNDPFCERRRAMLVLKRRKHQVICIGHDIKIMLVEAQHGFARIGIEAPRDVPVHRQEIYEKVYNKSRDMTRPIDNE